MKYRITFILLSVMILLGNHAFSSIVDKETAKKAAANYYFERYSQSHPIEYQEVIPTDVITISKDGNPLVYAVNFANNGFVLIAAEDNVTPFLGYSFQNIYSEKNPPEAFLGWLDYMKGQIVYYREQQIQADQAIQNDWKKYTDPDFKSKPLAKASKDVAPLVLSRFDQGKYYNSMCPADPAGLFGHVVTGCVATSMAQIMYYYRYPETGNGMHSYTANNPSGNPNYGNYGFQSVNYAATTYDWHAMVNEPNEANIEIAKLMYHCGVSVNMGYGPGASGAYTADVPAALINYFRYSSSTSYAQRMAYSLTQWYALITSNLDNKRPLIYSGISSLGGHAWIVDGYQVTGGTTMVHCNWGWSGMNDGYFSVDNLNPGGDPPYSSQQGVVKNIYPGSNYPAGCSVNHLITSTTGSIDDGSGNTANYGDNAACSWLIYPTDSVKKITLTFEKLATEAGVDSVTVYDGDNTSAPILGTFSGNTLPTNPVVSTKNKMLVTFTSNGSINDEGFIASFKSTYPAYCSGLPPFTTPTGTLSDRSGAFNYNNNTTCNFTIDPNAGPNLNLTFTEFDTEPDNDYIKIYDLQSSVLLATVSGHSLPPTVTSPSGKMFMVFKTDYIFNFAGWTATWNVGAIGIPENTCFHNFNLYPNPAVNTLHLSFELAETSDVKVDLVSMNGNLVYTRQHGKTNGIFNQDIDISNLSKGVYFLRLSGDKGVVTQKVVVQ